MTENPGYFVLRGVTSQDRAQKAAESIHEGLQPLRTSNESIEYAATPEAYEVYHDFVKSGIGALETFLAPAPTPDVPHTVLIGVFRPRNPHPTPKIASKDIVFATVALTELNASTGWYTLLSGSHLQSPGTPPSQWRKKDEELHPGDAIIWRGNLATLDVAGGGGKYLNVGYKIL